MVRREPGTWSRKSRYSCQSLRASSTASASTPQMLNSRIQGCQRENGAEFSTLSASSSSAAAAGEQPPPWPAPARRGVLEREYPCVPVAVCDASHRSRTSVPAARRACGRGARRRAPRPARDPHRAATAPGSADPRCDRAARAPPRASRSSPAATPCLVAQHVAVGDGVIGELAPQRRVQQRRHSNQRRRGGVMFTSTSNASVTPSCSALRMRSLSGYWMWALSCSTPWSSTM